MLTTLEIIIPIALLLVATFIVVFVGIVYHEVKELSDCYINVLLVDGPILLSMMCFWLMSAFAYWYYIITILTAVIILVGLVFVAIGIGYKLYSKNEMYGLIIVGAVIIFMYFCIVMPVAVF